MGSAAALVYAVAVATFPDERIYVATYWLHSSTHLDRYTGDRYTGEVSSPDTPNWYVLIAPVNTLALSGEDLIDDTKLAHILEKNESSTDAQRWVATLRLTSRDLTGADLRGADIRHVDFSDAILNRANLDNAWAKKASFGRADLQGASLDSVQLQGASLDGAQLQGASLHLAQLQGASLDGAQLQGASLRDAQLQGASLDGAQLQGASLDGAQLQGASLAYAQLQGASLAYAQIQGASLDGAQLQAASLDGAQLQGASLGKPGSEKSLGHDFQTGLLGERLLLQNALPGESFVLESASAAETAKLQGASFVDACVWRADARQAAWKDTWVAHPETGRKADKVPECDWTAASFAGLKRFIAKEVPEGDKRRAAMERIEQRLDPTKGLEGENEMAKIWAAREREAPTQEAYEKSLAGQWREVGCAAGGAPYVLHGLVLQFEARPFRDQSEAAKALAKDFLDEAHCPGAHGLHQDYITKLKKIAAPAAPQAPKP